MDLGHRTFKNVEPFREEDGLVVQPSELTKKDQGSLICYPGTNLKSFDSRVKQLKKIGVKELILQGESKIGRYGVLGKGCVSIVVRAVLKSGPEVVALKIRRADANRPSMRRDYELQRFANSFGVGPKALAMTKDLFAMEYVEATKIGNWFRKLRTRTPKKEVRKMVRNILTQCYLLDIHKLDHGELSNPSKHILLRKNKPETVIIDFESASTKRKASNLTAVAQFLLFAGGGKINKILGFSNSKQEKLSLHNMGKIIALLRTYKDKPDPQSFENILNFIKC